MNFFRHIAQALYKSAYDAKWVAAQRQQLGKAFGYFFLFLFVLLLVTASVLATKVPALLSVYQSQLLSQVPDGTVLSVKQGTLSIDGIDQPYRTIVHNEGDTDMLVYIDTVTTSSVSVEDAFGDAAHDMDAIIVTSKKVKVFDKERETIVHTEDVSSVPNFHITKEELSEKISEFVGKMLPWLVLFGSVFFAIVIGIGKLLFLAFLTWLVYVVVRADKKPWTYSQVFTIGVYLLTVPTLLQVVSFVTFGFMIPYMYAVTALIYMFYVVYRAGNITTMPSTSEDPVLPPSPPGEEHTMHIPSPPKKKKK